MTITNQRLRNLTTGIIHTNVIDIHTDLAAFTGIEAMTHQLPALIDAIAPYLKSKLTEPKFWDGKYDPTHIGETEIDAMSHQELDKAGLL